MSDLAHVPDNIPSPVGRPIAVTRTVSGFSLDWIMPEGIVPESPLHDEIVRDLFDSLARGVECSGRDATVFRNLAIRVDALRPNVGFDPDICLVEPRPDPFDSLCLWKSGARVPRLVIEVVSRNHPIKDYTRVPDICASLGVEELFVFDPHRDRGDHGRQAFCAWRRDGDSFRQLAPPGVAAYSQVLGAYLVVVDDRALRIAGDQQATGIWPTSAEAERAAKRNERTARDAERAAREAERAAWEAANSERAAKEAAVARAAELEAEIAALRGKAR
jgi:Uma2 family endonuclease